MAALPLQVGDIVIPVGRYVYAEHRCEVISIQRRRFRAEVRFPDGHTRWFAAKDLRYAGTMEEVKTMITEDVSAEMVDC